MIQQISVAKDALYVRGIDGGIGTVYACPSPPTGRRIAGSRRAAVSRRRVNCSRPIRATMGRPSALTSWTRIAALLRVPAPAGADRHAAEGARTGRRGAVHLGRGESAQRGRHGGPAIDRLQARASSSTIRTRRTSKATAPTASRWIRTSRRRASRGSNGAASTPSATRAAAANTARTGTRRA